MRAVDAASLPASTGLECDICIVGAGAAGLTLASELAGKGLDILVLEAGGQGPSADSQAFYEGETSSLSHPAPHMYRQRRLGGSTTIWGGRCVPFDPIDFEIRDYVPFSGWPFDRAALDPFYVRAQNVLDAGAFDYSAASAIAGGELVGGFHAQHVSSDGLERYSLPTDLWRKFSRRLATAPNVRLVFNAACLGLSTGENGRQVEQATFAKPDGDQIKVRARRFAICAGGLETFRLLAVSGPSPHGAGLGNHSDWLGRGYMCHAEVAVGVLRLQPTSRQVQHGFDRTRDGVYARRRFSVSPERQRELRIMNGIARLHHANVVDPAHGDAILSTMYLAKSFIIPEYRRKLAVVEHDAARAQPHDTAFWLAHAANLVRGAPGLATFLANWTLRRYVHRRKIPYVALHSRVGAYALDLNTEQSPDPGSRVVLTDQRDRFGTPRVRVDWRLNDLDTRTIAATLRELRQAVASSGVGEIAFDDDDLDNQAAAASPVGGHHLGTARMSDNPDHGVVDANLRVHHVDNLYVASCAAFPTSSQANPTLTLVALSLRLADHLGALDARSP